jgi:hypothetical protein
VGQSSSAAVINYPRDQGIRQQAKVHGLPEPVLVRDLVRIVEVLNLKKQGFFAKRSVLSGSMALRCFGSPRFTVYDADFSTSSELVSPEQMQDMLVYNDEDLDISPEAFEAHDAGETAWKYAPITYTPVFTALVPDPADRSFKADVSFRGLEMDGLEMPLAVPYSLDIWDEAPIVQVMDPHEAVAEKVLGWCVHRGVKHYADLAYVALAQTDPKVLELKLRYPKVRDILDEKLRTMTKLQPDYYARFRHIDALVGDLARPVSFDAKQWKGIMYIAGQRRRFTRQLSENAVREILVPALRRASPR